MSDNESNDEKIDEKSSVKTEISNMTFEELKKLKEKLGAKIYNEAVFGTKPKRKVSKSSEFKRDNKNRPREMSSKKPVPLFDNPKTEEERIRDPRFDSLCGPYNANAFNRSYSFLHDVRVKELTKLKSELRKTVDPERKEQIKYLIQRTENKNREDLKNREKSDKKKSEYMEKIKMMKEGKSPKFVRKSEQKVLDLVDQYKTLKDTGKLEKHISKHRKRHAQQDKKKSFTSTSDELH